MSDLNRPYSSGLKSLSLVLRLDRIGLGRVAASRPLIAEVDRTALGLYRNRTAYPDRK